MNYLGTTGLRHLIRKVRAELRDLEELISASGTDYTPTDWAEVQQIVRDGLGPTTFSVGDTFQCQHANYGVLTWQIVGFDADTPSDGQHTHSMTLQLKDPVQTLSYDGPNYFYRAEDGAYEGDYRFTLPDGTMLSFTLDVAVPSGGVFLLRMPEDGTAANAKVSVYEDLEGQILLTTVPVTEGGYGTELPLISDSEAILWGNGLWSGSGLQQYLNSAETKENVWEGAYNTDGCPEWVGKLDGFPIGLDEDFLNVLGRVYITTFDYSMGETVESDELFFLPTAVQVFGAYPSTEDQNNHYPYYYEEEVSYGDPYEGDLYLRVKTLNGTPCRWWLRNSTTSENGDVPVIDENGALTTAKATATTVAAAPMCCIV